MDASPTKPAPLTTTVGSGSGSGAPQISRLLLFARTDREKEDWYRRLVAASRGRIADRRPPPLVPGYDDLAEDTGAELLVGAALPASDGSSFVSFIERSDGELLPEKPVAGDGATSVDEATMAGAALRDGSGCAGGDEADGGDGLLQMTPCAYRGPVDYVRFMEHYKASARNTGIGRR